MLRSANSTGSRPGRHRIARLRALGVAVITAVSVTGVSSAAPGAAPQAAAPGVDPGTVELTLGPGQSATVAKRVTTPAVAPKPDIVILGDTTGSMDPVVANVRNNITNIVNRVREAQPDSQFGVTAYKEQGDGTNVFKIFTPLTNDVAAVRAGMERMSHDVIGGGAPWTDFINAHYRIATDAIAFRPNSTRMVAWFGDATSHDPSLGHTLAQTNAALRAVGARVIAVPLVGTSGDGLDRLGQATSITNATRGRLMSSSQADQVAQAILDGLTTIDVTVTPQVTSCDSALTVALDPANRLALRHRALESTVRSGTDANFNETFQVRPDAAAGTYHCSVDFLVNGASQGFVQNTTVHVPGLSIGDATVTEGDSGTTLASFTVTLDRAPTTPVTAHWATADGSATAPRDYLTRGGNVTFAPGQPTSQQVDVPIVGDLTVEQQERFTVGLTNPGGAAITKAAAIGTINDNDDIGTPKVSIGDVTITEGDNGTARANFTVSLDQSSTREVTVQATTSDGTALSPGDYTGKTELITFPPGQTSRPFTVDVLGDLIDEADETFAATLTNPVNAIILDGTGSGTIVDNDPPPSLSIGDVSVIEGDTGAVAAVFTISLNRPTPLEVAVDWSTENGTAMAPGDYTRSGNRAIFAPNQTTTEIAVPIVGDVLDEIDERFSVNLANESNATIADRTGVATIVNDDPINPPANHRLSIGDVTVAEGRSGIAQATFTINLIRGSATEPVTVGWATADGSATVADNDYATRNGRETFIGDQTTKQVTIDITGDSRAEPDETFTVNLSNPTVGTGLTDPRGVGTIRNDDVAGRSGVFSCTATALNMVRSTANPANVPCRDDHKTTPVADIGLGGLVGIRVNGLTATTNQTPDDLSGSPTAGDNATSTAELASVKIRILAVVIEVGVLTSTATASCVDGPNGLVPQFSGRSTIAALKINGVAIPVGSGPIVIPLLIGSLRLNTTMATDRSVTQQAFALETPLGCVIIGEGRAGVQGTATNPSGNPCR